MPSGEQLRCAPELNNWCCDRGSEQQVPAGQPAGARLSLVRVQEAGSAAPAVAVTDTVGVKVKACTADDPS